jgi:hypothetical protein
MAPAVDCIGRTPDAPRLFRIGRGLSSVKVNSTASYPQKTGLATKQ